MAHSKLNIARKGIMAVAAASMFSFSSFVAPSSGLAAGGGDGGGNTSIRPKCRNQGEVYSLKERKCVNKAEAEKKKKSSSLDQEDFFVYGRQLAYAGEYEQAIDILKSAPDQDDARVLNMVGFSNRKLGNIDVALKYYEASIAANPNYSLVREYLGEAYLQMGMLEKAREQLSEIERICGTRTCEEYDQLASLIIKSQVN